MARQQATLNSGPGIAGDRGIAFNWIVTSRDCHNEEPWANTHAH